MPDSPDRNLRFAAAVAQATATLSQREVRRRTGISATYVGDMLWGKIPSFRKLEQLARGLELHGELVQELFEAAGYQAPPDLLHPAPADDYDRTFQRAWRAAKARLEADGVTTTDRGALQGGADGLTAADAEAEVAEIERLLRKYAEGR
jgi:hypothetical protein